MNESILAENSSEISQVSFECKRKDSCIYLNKVLQEKAEIQSENDKLREIFQMATREFEKKNRKISEFEKTIDSLKEVEKENKLLKLELEKEKANVRILNKLLYGRKTEKQVTKSDDVVENEDEFTSFESEKTVLDTHVVKTEKTNRGAKEGHKGHGRKIPDNLPVVEETIDLSEDKKHCDICGTPFIETGMEEVSSEICVKKVYYVKKIIRKKYKKGCNCGSKIIVAPLPRKLISKGKFSIELWVQFLTDKYMKHLPVTRQIFDMKLHGIHVSSGTVISGFKKIYGSFIEPLYKVMIEEYRKSDHCHADETGYHIYLKIEGKNNFNWFMWIYGSKEIILFVVDPTRSSKVPYKVFFNMDEEDIKNLMNNKLFRNNNPKKILNADEYSAYKALQNQGLLLIAYCWSHQRRKFTDLIAKYPEDKELKAWVDMWVKKIAELYKVNNERIKYKKGTSAFAEYYKKLKTIIDWMKKEINKEYKHPVKIEIISSMKEHWSGLILFVERSEIPMDNNRSERMLRPVALGRNNFWGSNSIWGGELSASMYSIIQTCLLHGISPVLYLMYYFEECAKRGSAPNENEIDLFLPHKLPEKIKQKLKIPETEVLDDT